MIDEKLFNRGNDSIHNILSTYLYIQFSPTILIDLEPLFYGDFDAIEIGVLALLIKFACRILLYTILTPEMDLLGSVA